MKNKGVQKKGKHSWGARERPKAKKIFFSFHIYFVSHTIMTYIKNYLHPVDGKLKQCCNCSTEDHFP